MQQKGIPQKIINKIKIMIDRTIQYVDGEWLVNSKKFCGDHKQIIISALALSIFFFWTRKESNNHQQRLDQTRSQYKLNADLRSQEQSDESRVITKKNQLTKNQVKNLQKLLEAEQLEEQDPHDKLFFYIQNQYRNDNRS